MSFRNIKDDKINTFSVQLRYYAKRVTSGGVHLRNSGPGNTALKKHQSRGELLAIVSDLTGPGIEPKTSSADSDVCSHYANWMVLFKMIGFKSFH